LRTVWAARKTPRRTNTRRRNKLGRASLAKKVAIAARAGIVAMMIEGPVVEMTSDGQVAATMIAEGIATPGATTIDEQES
jgi:hypothetical protein